MRSGFGHARRRGLVALLLLLLLVVGLVLLGACASDAAGPGSPPLPLATATALGDKDVRLRKVLEPRAPGQGWEREATAWTSPGWRAAKDKQWNELGARIGATADDALEIGMSQFPATRLRLVPHGAESVNGELRDGHLVYRGAHGEDVDVVVTTTRHSVEELFVIRAAHAARISFAWVVTLPSGIARAITGADGLITFVNERGESIIRVPAAYALDQVGTRRDAKLAWDEGAHLLSVELDAQGLAFPVLLDPAFEVVTWEKVEAPLGRSGHAMVYDAARGKVVVFGGNTGSANANDTWTWDGATWTQATGGAPFARQDFAMAYDAVRGKVVLFGGRTGSPLADTWTWDGTSWSNVTPASPGVSPPPRSGHAMAFDGTRVIVYGGYAFGAYLGDTWAWDGAGWTNVTPPSSSPSPGTRAFHQMAYDPAHGNIVAFGGMGSAGPSETWGWNGTIWSLVSPAGNVRPNPQTLHTMAYDGAKLVLFGGNAGTGPMNQTWAWDGANWSNVTPASAADSPSARWQSAMTYDSARGRAVLFGGSSGADETWTRSGSTWTRVSPSPSPLARGYHAMSDDGFHAKVVLFGGLDGVGNLLGDSWTWDGLMWSNATPASPAASPSARQYHKMAYDPVRKNVVLFGGYDGAIVNDTWTWNGTIWSNVTPALPADSPSVRDDYGMAFDVAHGNVLVLFGGWNGGRLNDTWTWNGIKWTNATPSSPTASPSVRNGQTMAYDAARERVVLFGGYGGGSSSLRDTWTWDGAAWTNVTPAAAASSPSFRTLHGMAYDAARKRVVVYGGGDGPSGLMYDDTWTWDGSIWTQVSTGLPPGRRAHAMAYDAARSKVVLFGGFDTLSYLNDTWLYSTRGGACTLATDCSSGFCVDGVCCEVPSCGKCQACDLAPNAGVCSAVKNAADTDTCTGAQACDSAGACRPGIGGTCTAAGQCASGFCVDGTCCDRACTGFCEACTAALKASGADGACGPAKNGVDPHGDCPDDKSVSCQRDGQCDGTGRCRVYAKGTACGPNVCAQNRLTPRVCDGIGVCVSSAAATDCAPYACDSVTGACGTTCATNGDCAPSARCDDLAHTCISKELGSCDGDHTVLNPNGSKTDCAPYKCAASSCKETCTSIRDCAYPSVCDANGKCILPTDNAGSPDDGCSCASARHDAPVRGRLAAAAILVSLFFGRRRRRSRLHVEKESMVSVDRSS